MTAILALAWATLPPVPVRGTPVVNECSKAIPFNVGEIPPEDFIDPGAFSITCRGVLVPTSQVAHLLALQAWANGAEDIHNGQVLALEAVLMDSAPKRGAWIAPAAVGLLAGFVIGIVSWRE